jgi:hypothetical protein
MNKAGAIVGTLTSRRFSAMERALEAQHFAGINFLQFNSAVNAVSESDRRTADRNGEDPSLGRQPDS